MGLVWFVGGALAGGLAGAAMRGVVYRMSVPYGEPERTGCVHCQRPIDRRALWPPVRCRRCGGRLGTPLVLELTTAAVLAVLAGRFAAQSEAAAFAFLGVLGVALAAIDIAVQRLPDRLTLPAYPIVISLFAVAAVVGPDPGALPRALLGGAVLAGSFLVLALLRPGQLGTGDIKLAGLLGIALGWLGWPVLLIGSALGFVLLTLFSLAMLAARRVTLRSDVSFGPFMLAGALVAALL